MRLAANSWWTKGFLIGALLAIPAAANARDDAYPIVHDDAFLSAGDDTFFEAPRDTLSREILATIDSDEPPESSFRDHLHFTKKRGIEYRHVFSMEHQRLFLRFYGPVIKKNPGIGFELNGLKLGDFELRMRGYGTTKKVGFMFKVDF